MNRLAFSRRAVKELKGLDRVRLAEAEAAFRKFVSDARSPGLNFEALSGYRDLFSVRITRGDRAILRRRTDDLGELYEIVAIGGHDIYRELGRL